LLVPDRRSKDCYFPRDRCDKALAAAALAAALACELRITADAFDATAADVTSITDFLWLRALAAALFACWLAPEALRTSDASDAARFPVSRDTVLTKSALRI